MNFDESEDHQAIRQAVRAVCPAFDDSYWADMDDTHQFPWKFYDAMAAGG